MIPTVDPRPGAHGVCKPRGIGPITADELRRRIDARRVDVDAVARALRRCPPSLHPDRDR